MISRGRLSLCSVFTINVLLAFAFCETLGGESKRKDVLIDFKTASVDGVSIRQDVTTLEMILGTARVKKTEEIREGYSQPLIVLSFDGHLIYKHWNAFSFTDRDFRTKEGLGIGSAIADFEMVYGRGQLSREEGCSIHFRDNWTRDKTTGHYGQGTHIAIIDMCTYNSKGVAKEIYVW